MKYVSVLFLCCTQFILGQALTVSKQIELEVDTFIGYDNYNNLYTIQGMNLHKNGASGNFIFTDFQLGNITSVDIINPLNIVVFYADTNTVVLLDNKLTQIERITFNTLQDFANISSAQNAGGNKLWLFNADSQQLEVYNYRTKTKNEISLPISEIVNHQASNFNYNYILTATGIRVYTVFGGILKTIPFSEGEKIIISDQNIMVLRENLLFTISEKNNETNTLTIPEISIQDLQLSQDFLYIYDRKKISSFALNKPNK